MWKWRWPSWAPVPNKPTVSVDVKQHFNINTVKVAVDVPGSPTLIVRTFSVHVKQH